MGCERKPVRGDEAVALSADRGATGQASFSVQQVGGFRGSGKPGDRGSEIFSRNVKQRMNKAIRRGQNKTP